MASPDVVASSPDALMTSTWRRNPTTVTSQPPVVYRSEDPCCDHAQMLQFVLTFVRTGLKSHMSGEIRKEDLTFSFEENDTF